MSFLRRTPPAALLAAVLAGLLAAGCSTGARDAALRSGEPGAGSIGNHGAASGPATSPGDTPAAGVPGNRQPSAPAGGQPSAPTVGVPGAGASPGAAPAASPHRHAVPTAAPQPPRTPAAGATPGTRPAAGPTPTSSRPPAAGPGTVTGPDWTRLPTSRRVVALTFDAGANADGVPSILATLAREGVPGTFFLTGAWTRQYPALAQRIVAAGHTVGNHTLTHPMLTTLDDAAVAAEIRDGAAAIEAVTGVDPHPFFRFPYGDVDQRVLDDVHRQGYAAVRWTVDTTGWRGTSGGMTASKVVDRVMAAAAPGEIVLMHVGSHPTDRSTLDADALPTVIDRLRAAGYSFTTLDLLRP